MEFLVGQAEWGFMLPSWEGHRGRVLDLSWRNQVDVVKQRSDGCTEINKLEDSFCPNRDEQPILRGVRS